MFTVAKLAKHFGISRSTLLYYDKIGLLKPSGRTSANYRLYCDRDFHRMTHIATYREAGLPLESIAAILDQSGSPSSTVLEQRLMHLNQEISRLRQQQQLIVGLLGQDPLFKNTKVLNKDQWVRILKASGMDEPAMRRWHIEFERDMPEAHTDFLESLGISSEEITKIKAWADAC